MTLPALDCEIPADTCCPWLFDDADYMLGALETAYTTCVGAEACSTMKFFVSWGIPAIADTDYLTVWLNGITLVAGNGGIAAREVSWTVLLSESNYPTFSKALDGTIISPDVMLLHEVNRHVYAHAAALESAIAVASANGALLPTGCMKPRISALVPAVGGGDVKGGTAGVRLTITYQRYL